MFGGPHHRDEVKWDRAICREREGRTKTAAKVLATEVVAALLHECLPEPKKPWRVTLDTADFVRHVPTFSLGTTGNGQNTERAL